MGNATTRIISGAIGAVTLTATLGTALTPRPAPAGAIPIVTTVAGGNGVGTATDQTSGPRGVAVDPSGNLFVVDSANNRVQKWLPGAAVGLTVAGGNGQGSAQNQLDLPRGVALDGSGAVYVADTQANRVQKWIPGSVTGVTIAGGNGEGAAANQLNYPYAVAVRSDGSVYVADFSNHRVQRWLPGALTGITVAGGNGPGSGPSQLNGPTGIAVTANGVLYVVDQGNNRVQSWIPGASFGVTVAGGNGPGSAANQLNGPYGIVRDTVGNLYISDSSNQRVQRWAPGASSGVTVAGGNGEGTAADQFRYPAGVALDASGRLYVADDWNSRVQRWVMIPGTPTGVSIRSGSTTSATGPLVVKFTATPVTGGSTITAYNTSCTSSNGGVSRLVAGTTSPITVTGATTGKAYSCRVRAVNGRGAGVYTPASNSVIVGSPPAPTLTGVTRPAAGQLRVTYSVNGSNGSPLTGFTAYCTSANGGAARSKTVTLPTARAINVTGLTVGKTYSCKVRAVNARGPGLYSAASANRIA